MNIDKTLLKEYDLEKKPLNDFPDKLIKHLINKYNLKGKILDVMCGRGEHAESFKKNNLDTYCLDISRDAASVFSEKEKQNILLNCVLFIGIFY